MFPEETNLPNIPKGTQVQNPKIIGHMVSENRCEQLSMLQKERMIRRKTDQNQ